MKKGVITTFCICTISLLQGLCAYGAPQSIRFNGMAFDSEGVFVSEQMIQVEVSILSGGLSGDVVLREWHMTETNEQGFFEIFIGDGLVQEGDFESISWQNENHYLNIGIDLNAGSNFTNMGTTQFLSVPYVHSADLAGTLSTGLANDNLLSIGMYYQGGIIFQLNYDSQGDAHGLIVSLEDLEPAQWGALNNYVTGLGLLDGEFTSTVLEGYNIDSNTAAGRCIGFESGGYDDWFLGSTLEMFFLMDQKYNVNLALQEIEGADIINDQTYWTSSQHDNTDSFCFFVTTNWPGFRAKSNFYAVRPIRSF